MCASSGGSSFSPRSATHTLEYRKGRANGNVDFLSRLSEPAKEHDRSGSSSLALVDVGGTFIIRVCGLRTRSLLTPVLAWVGWCPAPTARLAPFRLFRFLRFSRARATCED